MSDENDQAPTAGVTGEQIWLDGKFVDWSAANVHVLTHTLHYGLGVFEGIRCYRTHDDRSAVFRLSDHVRRLFDSARINLLEIPFHPEEIEQALLTPGHDGGAGAATASQGFPNAALVYP